MGGTRESVLPRKPLQGWEEGLDMRPRVRGAVAGGRRASSESLELCIPGQVASPLWPQSPRLMRWVNTGSYVLGSCGFR